VTAIERRCFGASGTTRVPNRPTKLVGVLVALVLAVGLAACGGDDGGGDAEEVPDARRRADGIEVGDCYDEPEDDRDPVAPISCDESHDNEAYAAFQLEDGEYPGDAAVLADASTRCLERFEGFVGVTYDSSGYDVDALTPTRLTWDDGDRKVVCILFLVNGEQTTGTAQGSQV
jgi:hypothetical protein